MESNLGKSRKRVGNYKGGVPGRKNHVCERRFIYFSEAAAKANFDPVKEIAQAVQEKNHEMVKALIPLLKYMAPEISPVTIEGEEPEKDDINVNISLNGLLQNEQDSND